MNIKSFDHSPLTQLPEYPAVRRAIDELGRRIDEDSFGLDRDAFIEAIGDMALTSYAADCCERCGDLTWPHAGKVDKDHEWLSGRYFCATCGRVWSCGYTTRLYMLAEMP